VGRGVSYECQYAVRFVPQGTMDAGSALHLAQPFLLPPGIVVLGICVTIQSLSVTHLFGIDHRGGIFLCGSTASMPSTGRCVWDPSMRLLFFSADG